MGHAQVVMQGDNGGLTTRADPRGDGNLRNALVSRVQPLPGGLALLGILVSGLTTQSAQVSVVVGVLVAAGLLVAIAVRQRSSAPYFAQHAAVHPVVDEGEADLQAHPS